MFHFTPHAKERFKSVGVCDVLPAFQMFAGSPGTHDHFVASCIEGSAVERLALDVRASHECFACSKSAGMRAYEALFDELVSLEVSFDLLELTEETVAVLQLGFGPPIEDVVRCLNDINRTFGEYTENVPKTSILYPYVDTIFAKLKNAETILVEYLRTDEGKEALAQKYAFQQTFTSEVTNAALVDATVVRGAYLAIVKAYGDELIPGIFLAYGIEHTLIRANKLEVSPLFVSKDTPVEVLQTMARLWEPASSAALGDARKALVAAWELTPGVT